MLGGKAFNFFEWFYIALSISRAMLKTLYETWSLILVVSPCSSGMLNLHPG